MTNAKTLVLRTKRRFTCGTASFSCDAGKLVFLRQHDKQNRMVLLDFGDRYVDWFHESVLEDFAPLPQHWTA